MLLFIWQDLFCIKELQAIQPLVPRSQLSWVRGVDGAAHGRRKGIVLLWVLGVDSDEKPAFSVETSDC